MLVTCPECNKKLKVPESVYGKKIRCPGCKNPVAVPGHAVSSQPVPRQTVPPSPVPPMEIPPPIQPPLEIPPVNQKGTPPPAKAAAPKRSTSSMLCALCKEGAVQALPANAFSRRPGYSCVKCEAIMRPPGSTGGYAFAIILGTFMVIISIILVIATIGSDAYRMRGVGGAASLAVLGIAVAGWAAMQLRLPIPLNAPKRRSRLWLWLVVFLVGLLIAGGAIFFFMYYLQEML